MFVVGSEHEKAINDAVTLARAGRLEAALRRLDDTAGAPRSRELQRNIDNLRTTLLFWLGRWDQLTAMPDGMIDEKTRAIALMQSGQLAQAEVVIRSAPSDGSRDALLAEVLARQGVDIGSDDEVDPASADALIERARQLAADDPGIAARIAEAAIDSEALSPGNRVVALILAGRIEDARVVATGLGPDAAWFVEAIDRAANGHDLESHLDTAASAELLGSAQILLHQLGRYEAAIAVGRKALERGGDMSVIGFNIACSAVRSGDTDMGVAFVESVVEDGLDVTKIVSDHDLAVLRGTDSFAAALGESGPVGSAGP